jgi:hypothetical protein
MIIRKYSIYIGSYLQHGMNHEFYIGYYEDILSCFFKDNNLYIVTKGNDTSASKTKKVDVTIVNGDNFSTSLPDDYEYVDKQDLTNTDLTNTSYGNSIQMNLVSTTKTFLFFKRVEKTKEEIREEKITEIINEN